MVNEKPDPLLGQNFGEHYQILSVLGRGGMSVVYKAKHKLMDRIVAIKVLHGDVDQTGTERFKHEAQTASALNHPNIVSVYEFGFIDGHAFLVMDCLEGENLNEILQKDVRIPVERAINIFRQACLGLDHAHKKGVVHRDLKPGNLCIIQGEGGNEIVKIVDFGIAKLMPETGKDQTRLTQTGEVFGSPLYMSPEQCLARPIDLRSDIYSLGCLMYECLTGSVPIEGDTAYETMTMHVHKAPESFAKKAPDLHINPSIEAIVFRCLEKKPEDRYQSCGELMADLPTIKAESGSMKVKSIQHPTKQKQEIKFLRYGFWTLFVFCAAVFAYMSCDNGSELDRGTVLEKTIWNAQTTLAQTLVDAEWYEPGRKILESAESTARSRFSNKARLLTVLNMQKHLYEKARLFEDLDLTNKKIATVNNQILLKNFDLLMAELERTAKPASSAQTSLNKITAPIKVEAIDHLAKSLVGAGMIQHAEQMILRAKEVYTSLLGPADTVVGDLDMRLADCYQRRQRLAAERPLLVEALNIYEKSTQPNSRRYVEALLKLGELDRIVNRYDIAKTELADALNIAQKHFPQDTNLNCECLNAYACYFSELGKDKEAKELFDRASKLKLTDLIEE
ncbi:MAG: serine/threonine protein kinase [Cyanobacteria bacterium SZAS TMP-1]|nr:serine/threonine protein kinase [Cyanobacteria bacterium SZAS TMP-1]